MNYTITTRRLYTFTEWLAEVGGFASALLFVSSTLLGLFETWSVDNYLIRKLYRRAPKEETNQTHAN